ncbi:DUF4867 family protein [Qiania dongpingensis]|uniref:DUF4867 family protein n=1 Tax=Qiania dongpingensis TaxID=2763669 RepID=A0A7G9G0T0_9FIRM|nr:DUF4867 family protein [Qiania dongpingensis]QNM04412.1 DUF4867 family protein [Qiania dongpingensis]
MEIKKVTDKEFKKYGAIVEGMDFSGLVDWAKTTPAPDEVIYEPSVKEAEEMEICEAISRQIYGEMPIQIGYCNGKNHKADTMEYHRGEELDIAVTDMIVVVGSRGDMDTMTTFDLSNAEAFLVPAGTAVLLYSSTLHYAPCSAGDGVFQCIIVLPEGTNVPSEKKNQMQTEEDKLLCMKNKWVLTHPDSGEDFYPGLKGDIIRV